MPGLHDGSRDGPGEVVGHPAPRCGRRGDTAGAGIDGPVVLVEAGVGDASFASLDTGNLVLQDEAAGGQGGGTAGVPVPPGSRMALGADKPRPGGLSAPTGRDESATSVQFLCE